MKNVKQWIALTLAAAMLMPLVACSEKPSETEDTSNAALESVSDNSVEDTAEVEADEFAKFEDMDFADQTINIISRAFERHSDEITVDESKGEIINDAIYDRQLMVEDMLGVTINNEKMEPGNEHGGITVISNLIQADDSSCDLFASSFYATAPLSIQGYFRNLYEVENLDLTQDYWSQYYNQKAQVGKKLYTTTGDLALSNTRFLFAVFFNKTLINEYNIEDPYTMVKEGTWTFEKMNGIVKDLYNDLNGDSTRDITDLYGMGVNTWLGVDAFTSAFDLQLMTTNDDGFLEISINKEKYDDVVNKLYDFYWESTGTYTFGTDDIADYFSRDLLVFCQSWIYNCESTYLRDMQSDYGIIPYPKYDAEQENYYSYGHDQITVFTVPTTAANVPMSGAVMEAMCAVSDSTVVESYYEVALKEKFARDSESAQMLDLIRDSFLLDSAWIYCENVSIMARILRTLVEGKSPIFASYYKRQESKYIQGVADLNAAFALLEQ